MNERQLKTIFVALAFALFSIIIIGLVWLASGSHPVSVALSYAAGLSMIFLPCTLPLVFVIIPLSTGKGYLHGLTMASLFGLGLAVTLTFYGIVVALVGDYFGLDRFSRGMFFVAGIVAYAFGLTQLSLVRLRLPQIPMPRVFKKKHEYTSAFLMGLLLGNAGVGCPNPAFYVLLLYIATTSSPAVGGWLGFVHGLGRATPLIFLSVLAILGVNASKWVVARKTTVDKLMGWGLLIVGVFVFSIGFFGMTWWEASAIHQGWNEAVSRIAPRLAETPLAAMSFGITKGPSIIEKYWPAAPWYVMLLFLIIPYVWLRCKKR